MPRDPETQKHIEADAKRVQKLLKLKSNASGLRSETIREKLDLTPPDVRRALQHGIATGVITKQGEKRATTYFAGV